MKTLSKLELFSETEKLELEEKRKLNLTAEKKTVKRIKVNTTCTLEDSTWNRYLRLLRSGINTSPFSEILSPETGKLYIELKNYDTSEDEIAGILKKTLTEITIEKPELVMDEADTEVYRQLDDIPYALNVCNNNHMELKVELIREDTAYLNNLHLCYILANQNLIPWYYQHYIQIRSWPPYSSCNYKEFGFEYTAEIMEKINVMGYRILRRVSNIIEFIMDNIDDGNYMLINVDEFYLPQKVSFHNRHFVHPPLVYGYDNEKRKILALVLTRIE